jgi:putative endonuclease
VQSFLNEVKNPARVSTQQYHNHLELLRPCNYKILGHLRSLKDDSIAATSTLLLLLPLTFAYANTIIVYMYYVYILTDKNNNVLYTGVTNNLARRVYEHKSDLIDGFTKRYHVHKLVYYEYFSQVEAAIYREKAIKGLLRSKKISLIESVNPNWEELQVLPF